MLHRRAFAFCVTWGVVFENEIYTIRRRASAGLMCRNRSRLFHIYFLVLFVVVGLGFRVTQRGRLSCLSLSERLYHRRRSGDMDSGEDVSYNRPIHCQKTRHDMRGERWKGYHHRNYSCSRGSSISQSRRTTAGPDRLITTTTKFPIRLVFILKGKTADGCQFGSYDKYPSISSSSSLCFPCSDSFCVHIKLK